MSGTQARRVAGVIDAGGVYTSRAAAAGGYVFVAGTAIDESGRVGAAARPKEPYGTSEPAGAAAQSRYMLEALRAAVTEVGSSLEQLCQLEQYVKLKVHTDAYFGVARDPAFLGRARPGGATAQLAGFHPDDVAVSITGLGVATEPGSGPVKSYPGEKPEISPAGLFSSLVAAGPYVFNTYFGTDNKTGIHPSARAEDWNWRGSEIATETAFGIQQLTEKLAVAGATLSDIVNYTLFLADPADLYEFDQLFAKAVGNEPPSRVVIPSRGFANPRREGAFGHAENAERMEIQVRALRTDAGAKRVTVDGPGAGFGHQSAAVRVDPLLWVSGQYADPSARGTPAREAANVLEKIAMVCRSGGTDITNVLRVHAIVRRTEDATAVYAAMKSAVPHAPPAVAVIHAPVLPVRDASIMLDAVAYVPGN